MRVEVEEAGKVVVEFTDNVLMEFCPIKFPLGGALPQLSKLMLYRRAGSPAIIELRPGLERLLVLSYGEEGTANFLVDRWQRAVDHVHTVGFCQPSKQAPPDLAYANRLLEASLLPLGQLRKEIAQRRQR